MTKAAVQGYVNRANSALAAGQCDLAGEAVSAGYSALQDYANQLAMQGLSPAPTIKLQKALAKAHARQQRQCVTDSLIAPSFSGPLDRENIFPTLGFVFGLIGLGIGFGTIYKNS